MTDYDYDSAGNLTQLKITDTATSTDRIWSYTYNSYGQVLTENGSRTDVSDQTAFSYYSCATGAECGQIHTITNAAGHVTTFDSYDQHGRPTQITDPNGLVTTLAYNLRGNLTSKSVGSEQTTYDYDDAQQLTRVTQPDGSYLQYSYDAAHRLISVADQDGNHPRHPG